MKKMFLLPVLFLITLVARSQYDILYFGGVHFAGARYTIQNQKQKNQIDGGFQVGIGLKIPFEDKLFFSPEAFYSLKGYKVKFRQFVYPPDPKAESNRTLIHTFELAALLQYDFSLDNYHWFVKAGPTLDFLLAGREKFHLKDGGVVKRKMPFSLSSDYGPISSNLLLKVGRETTGGTTIFFQYTHGTASISNEDGGPKIRLRTYGISVGKYLNRKKVVINTKNRE